MGGFVLQLRLRACTDRLDRRKTVGSFRGTADSRNGDEHQDGDNRHHDQQLHQSETVGLRRTMGALASVQKILLAFHGFKGLVEPAARAAHPKKCYNVWTMKGNQTLNSGYPKR